MSDWLDSILGVGNLAAETGIAGTNGIETGIIDDLTDDSNNGSGSPAYVYYGGGGGSSGSSKTPEDVQKETQNQIWNTQANYFKRRGDMDKLSKDSLGNIEKQMKANDALLRQQNVQNQRSIQWQPNQQREQSTLMALRNRMGNAAYGSSLVDLNEGMGRVDDMNDEALIESWRENADNAYSNWFQANAQLVSDYNDQATSIEDEYSKLYSQYWSAMSNLNPMLATYENMVASNAYGKPESEWNYPVVGEGTDLYAMNPIILEPDEELKKMLQHKEHASEKNPLTKGYVRPDKGQTSYGGINGMYGKTAANKAFYDNIRPYSKTYNA